MIDINRFTIFLVIIILIGSCNGSDSSKKLGSGYWISLEGRNTCEILNHDPDVKEIPPAVMGYNYNDNFIIAQQRPNDFDDILHEEKLDYKNGRDTLYYWIIIKDSKQRVGPLDEIEYKAEKVKHGIPDDLDVEPVY